MNNQGRYIYPISDIFQPYLDFVLRGTRFLGDTPITSLHMTNPQLVKQALAMVGLNTEAGEAGDVWKKAFFHGATLDREKLKLELGDVLWYFTLALDAFGFSWEEVLEANMEKLTKRYPEWHK